MIKFLLLIILVVQIVSQPIYSQTKNTGEATEVAKPEPPAQYPKQTKNKAWWEHVLSFPGNGQ